MADNRKLEEKLMSEDELMKAFEKRDTGSTYSSPVREFLRENKDDPDNLKKLVEYALYSLKDPRKEEAEILFSRFYSGVEKSLKPAVAAILKDRLSEEDKSRIEKFLKERSMIELGIRQKYPEFVAAVYGKDYTHEAPVAKPTTEVHGGSQPARTPPQSQAADPPQSKVSKPLPATGQPTPTGGTRNLPYGAYSYGIPSKEAKQNLNPVKQSSAPSKQGSEQPGPKPGTKK